MDGFKSFLSFFNVIVRAFKLYVGIKIYVKFPNNPQKIFTPEEIHRLKCVDLIFIQ